MGSSRASATPTPPLILLAGPTAAGKSSLAVGLWEALDGAAEIISVDSAQIYRGMDIGTAKPTTLVRQRVPHHLVDILDPAEVYSAARFAVEARTAVESIRTRGRIPILVGGTMLYFRALMRGLSSLPSGNQAVRETLATEAKTLGWPALHARLALYDKKTAERVHPNDAQRIQRALEIIELTAMTPSFLYRHMCDPWSDDLRPWRGYALTPVDRRSLHRKIETRFTRMMEAGFLDEVRSLHARNDLHPDLPSMRAVGYRQLWAYLDGKYTIEGACAATLAATRQYAKRQLTWLRAESQLTPLDISAKNAITGILEDLKAMETHAL